jgi:hypothetical protein
MNIKNKIYPLMSYRYKVVGLIFLIITLIFLILCLIYNPGYTRFVYWLICFSLFCITYSKEKNENESVDLYEKLRYHSFRISIALTTIIALISSFSFIIENKRIEINCLHTVIFLLFTQLVVYYFLKMKIK